MKLPVAELFITLFPLFVRYYLDIQTIDGNAEIIMNLVSKTDQAGGSKTHTDGISTYTTTEHVCWVLPGVSI